MPVSLQKGGNVNLTKEAPEMKLATIGLGWDVRKTDGVSFDLDASAFMLDAEGKILGDASFIFFNNKVSPCGAVVHNGDNRTGEGDGDDESIAVTLGDLPEAVAKIMVGVTIHEADENGQNFGQVSNAYIRVVDETNATEVARYDLSEDASTETAMVFGELYRHNGDWKFKAVGQGYAGGLKAMAQDVGVNIG